MVATSYNHDFHKTVLLDETLTYMAPRDGATYIDATFGGGGHTKALLDAADCKVVAVDWDYDSLMAVGEPLQELYGKRLDLLWGNFAHLPHLLKKFDYKPVDGLLADFGTSQHQIFHTQGMSFESDELLDMRMSKAHARMTAADIVRTFSYDDLVHLFHAYGEERYARRIARAICAHRKRAPLKTARELADLIKRAVPASKGRCHPATRAFQALRIAVNRELENIHAFLHHIPRVVAPEGRIVCISFHSLEDRRVKRYFRDNTSMYRALNRGIVAPSPEEVRENPSSRSARLRAFVYEGA